MKTLILSLIFISSLFSQVDSMRVTWTDPVDSDLDSVRIYADTSASATTYRYSVNEGVEFKEWKPPYDGHWHVRMKAVDDSANVSTSYSNEDTVTIWLAASYDADAQAYFDVATGLSTNRKDTINTFIEMLKDSLTLTNLSDRMAGMWLLANSDTVGALVNIVYPDTVAVTNGGVTFAVDAGYTGNGTTGIINSKISPEWQSNITLNDLTYGVYVRNNVSENKPDIGFTDNGSPFGTFYIRGRTVTHGLVGSISNETDLRQFENAALTSAGFSMITRRGATDAELYRNGASYATSSTTSSGYTLPVAQTLTICGDLAGGTSTRQIAFVILMDGVTDDEALKINRCVEWMLDAIGAGVE